MLGFAVLFAYLFLVALYESWNIPVPALLSVSVGVLGAVLAVPITAAVWGAIQVWDGPGLPARWARPKDPIEA